jgi:hypothetical protein
VIWTTGEVRLLMWTHGASRPDLRLPGLLVLLALGWAIEAMDDRYGSVLMSLPVCPAMPVVSEFS